MDKSADAFRTISEVAEDLDLPQHVLRFWETRFSQIKPMKRGGGRRYYRPEDIDLLKGIRHLLYEQGYTIKGVQKLFKQNSNKFVIAIGSGDAGAFEALASGMNTEPEARDSDIRYPEDSQMVGQAKATPSRRFFGLGGDDKPTVPLGEAVKGMLSSDDRALLQEALYDLLECKRLLDQVR